MTELNGAARAAFTAQALAAWPEEACGLLLRDGCYLPCRNQAEEPWRSFRLDPILLLEREGEIAAVLHSHPFAPGRKVGAGLFPDCPSAWDLAQQAAMALPWGIALCDGQEVREPFFFGEAECPDGKTPPLIGRAWRSGAADCYALARDWFRLECNLKLPIVPREDDWEERDPELFTRALALLPLAPVPLGRLAPGDAVLAKLGKTPTPAFDHVGIYLGQGDWLHHLRGRLSRREPLGPWRKTLKGGLRWQE